MKFSMVVFPTIPDLSVERESVTFPISMVMAEGLGTKAKPDRLGPSVLVTFMRTDVTLKPLRALRPLHVLAVRF